jgi:hypothetical protein
MKSGLISFDRQSSTVSFDWHADYSTAF